MAYNIGGKNIYDLAEVISTSDPRSYTGFSTTPLFTYSGYSFQDWHGQRIAMADSGYMYSNDINNGKYKSQGYFLISKRGWRPCPSYNRRRWQSSTAGTYYLTKYDDGEIWVDTAPFVKNGTRIGTASEDINFFYVLMISGGGGGAGGNGTQSGGGGGGGAFAYHCVRIWPNKLYRMVLHGGGSAGGRNASGGMGGDCSFEMYNSANISSDGVYSYWVTGGSPGRVQEGGAGGNVSWPYNPTSSDTHMQILSTKSGQSGGGNRSGGGSNSSTYYTPAYNPEGITLDYGQANGGAGNYGGGGGSGWYFGHNGGKGGAAYEDGGTGGIGAGGGGGAFVLFAGQSGGKGGNSHISLFY